MKRGAHEEPNRGVPFWLPVTERFGNRMTSKPVTLEELARNAVHGPKWSLADGPCWCDMKREESARKGTKIHTSHCKAMKALSSYLFHQEHNSVLLDNATRPSTDNV